MKIESFVGRLPPAGQAALRLLVWFAVLAGCLTLVRAGWTVMGVEGRSQSISLPVQIARSWFYSIPLFVGAAGMALTCLYLALAEFWHAAGGAAPRPILEEPPPDPEPEIRFGREGAGP